MGGRLIPLPPAGRARDAALAGGVLVGPREEPWTATASDWALILLACGALLHARRRPVAVAALVLVTTGAHYVTGLHDGGLMIAVIAALYAVAAGAGSSAVVLAYESGMVTPHWMRPRR